MKIANKLIYSIISTIVLFMSFSLFAWEFKLGGEYAANPEAFGIGFTLGYDLFNEPIADLGNTGKFKFMMGPSLGYSGFTFDRPVFTSTGVPIDTNGQEMDTSDLEATEADYTNSDGEQVFEYSGYDEAEQARYTSYASIIPFLWTFKLDYSTNIGQNLIGAYIRPGIGWSMMFLSTDLPASFNETDTLTGEPSADSPQTLLQSFEWMSTFTWLVGAGVHFRNFFLEYQYISNTMENNYGIPYDMSSHEIAIGVNTRLSEWKD
jgi:hypothetical protein